MSIENNESIPEKVLMVDARRVGRVKEFFRINPGVDPKGRLTDVADRCRQLPIHLHLPT